jgi:ribose transport system ATP-binding protein
MRDGRVVADLDRVRLEQSSTSDLASLMVGRPMQDHFPPRIPAQKQAVLEVRDLIVAGTNSPISFEVNRGEIFGLAGLIGSGRTELAETIVGLRKKTSGRLILQGREISIGSIRDSVAAGIAYLSEDRKSAGLTLGMSVKENMTLVSLGKYGRVLIDRRAEAASANRHVAALGIRTPGIEQRAELLSGGNQQKVALAKWLEISPKVLIVDEPTRGVDIGAKEQIYAILHELTQAGLAVILISSELNEVIGMSHRIAVMRRGRIVDIVDAAMATEDSLMRRAAWVDVK